MAAVYGVGDFGPGPYSRGELIDAAAYARMTGGISSSAAVSRLSWAVAPFEADTSAHAALSPLAGVAAYAEVASEFYVGASTSSARVAHGYMSAGVSARAPITPFANLAGAAEPLAVAAQVDSEVQSDSALFTKVATAFLAELPGIKNAAATMAVSFSPFYAGVTPQANLAAYMGATTAGYVGVSSIGGSAAKLTAELQFKAVLRRTWQDQVGVQGEWQETPAEGDQWELQQVPPLGWDTQD